MGIKRHKIYLGFLIINMEDLPNTACWAFVLL
jgi:hypothetical protein